MKIYLTIILLSFINSCAQNTDDRLISIDNFISTYLLLDNPDVNVQGFPEYIHINMSDYKKLSQEKQIIMSKYISMLLDMQHKELKNNGYKYKVIKHAEADETLLEKYKLVYTDMSNVYYLLVNNSILTHYIFDSNRKIISFAPNAFTSHGGRIEPFMLDKIEAE